MKTETKKFYVLHHKKHKRQIWFTNEKESIQFIKQKLQSSLFKRILYFLIRTKIILPFLKKINMQFYSNIQGNVIFIANRIKYFDLHNKIVHTFPVKGDDHYKRFINTLNIRIKLRDRDCLPKLLDYNFDVPYFTEELLENKWDGDYLSPMLTLMLLNAETGLMHGDIVKDHIMKKNSKPVFIDWEHVNIGDGLEDLENFEVKICK